MFDRADLLAASAIANTLAHEGGFVNDPVDPGGATNYGISLRWLLAQGVALDLDGDGDVDAVDVEAMTVDEAVALYRAHWWGPYRCGELPEQIAPKYFDMIVNMGPSAGGHILQRAANVRLLRRRQTRLEVDGIVGSKTIAAVCGLCAGEAGEILLQEIRRGCERFYKTLIYRRPELEKYENGWLRRARS